MTFNFKKQQFINFCLKNDNKITKNNLPKIKFNQDKETVFIEFRLLPHTSFIIKNTILKLDNEWSHTIICGENNFDFYNKLKEELDLDIRIIKLNINSCTREDYSIMLMESKFWDQFYGKYILIYQEDSLIFRKFNNKFLKYDYIGAPWTNKLVGNGGFSLRKKEIMIRICKMFFDNRVHFMKQNVIKLNKIKKKLKETYLGKTFGDIYSNKNYYKYYLIERTILEDFQITDRMKKNHIGKVADIDIALEFSIEKFYHKNAFGGHQFWYAINNINNWLNNEFKIFI